MVVILEKHPFGWQLLAPTADKKPRPTPRHEAHEAPRRAAAARTGFAVAREAWNRFGCDFCRFAAALLFTSRRPPRLAT